MKLSPGPGWQWNGWDGVVTLDVAPHTVTGAGEKAVLASDIIAVILQHAAGKAYTASGFADVPGLASAVVATVNESTLAKTVQIQSMKAALETTEGTFAMTVGLPSLKIPPSSPPVPDPVPVKNGTWKIDQSHQRQVTAK